MDRRAFLRTAAGVAVGSLVAGCSGGDSGPSTVPDDTVLMITDGGNYYFDPIGLHVDPGTTVTFEDDSGNHSAAAYAEGNSVATVTRIPDAAEAWDSGTLSPGGTFQHTFEAEGTYDYFCLPHKSLGMVGRIVVGSPGGPAEGSDPPDGPVPASDRIVDEGSVRWSDFTG